jgi:hypothetical protein
LAATRRPRKRGSAPEMRVSIIILQIMYRFAHLLGCFLLLSMQNSGVETALTLKIPLWTHPDFPPDELASAMSGINVFRVYFPVYLISGLTASIIGMLLSGYSGQTYLGMGDSYLLIPIATVVIGGTTLAGGRGSYFRTLVGSVAVVLLDSVLTSLQVSPGLRKIFFGGIIVAMMLLFRRKRGLE